jgi:hypothetical protein
MSPDLKSAPDIGGNVVSRRQLALLAFTALIASGAAQADSCAPIEKSFQEVIASGEPTRNTLANLNEKLDRYGWTLTSYTVRLLHELEAGNLAVASERLRDDAYVTNALRNTMWDGFSGWSIVTSLRTETLEIFTRLEAVRTSEADKALARKAEKVTEWLLKEAASAVEPASSCERRRLT